MLYNTKALKRQGTTDSEYKNTESNSITTSSQTEQGTMRENSIITCNQNIVEFIALYKNKEITVHLEFPEHHDEEAATDFLNRLKEIYLEKIKLQSMQTEVQALQCTTTEEKEENTNG